MKFLLLSSCLVFLCACQKPVEKLGYKIVATRPHDPDCYTQGLEFSGKRLYESGGGYGVSTVREVEPNTGEVLRKRPMAKHVFAEGITILNNELWVLSWKENTVTVLEPETFKFLRSYPYKGEGWGLTNDGRMLIMSDGTSTLKFIEPRDFSIKRTVDVKKSGQPVTRINELEMIDGEIYANIYTTGEIVRISPEDGRVTGWLDLSDLRNQLPRPHKADVLNGIALDPTSGNLLVTGKLWSKMFEIRLEDF